MDSGPAYRPEDLLRLVDCLGGALVPGTDAVVYVANTLDGSTASDASALWLVEAGQHRRLVPSAARQAQPAVFARWVTGRLPPAIRNGTRRPLAAGRLRAVRKRGDCTDHVRPRDGAGRSGVVA
jgi:hypothetical protein